LNAKYMRAGLAPKDATEGLVPSLERPADLPQFSGQLPMPPMPINQSLAPPQQPSTPAQALPPAVSIATPPLDQSLEAPATITVSKPMEEAHDTSLDL